MALEDLLSIASGRVWSAIEAKERGLIDTFGSLEDAIGMAAGKAGIEEYKVVYYPEQLTFLEQLMSDLSEDVQTRWLKIKTGDLYPYLEKIRDLDSYIGIQARMPFQIEMN
jgi:protease-4